MIKIENVETMGWGGAIRGMRNAMNSWDKSDSKFCHYSCITKDDSLDEEDCNFMCASNFCRGFMQIGKADMKLCKNLIKAGSSDRKFMRMIHVQADVTAPQYWWREFDTYKIATTANSTSQMHKIHSRNLTLDDFSHEHLDEKGIKALETIIAAINDYRVSYKETKDKEDWYRMIQLIPQSSHYLRTVDLNYETLLSIYHQRKNHKLDEWREFCKWIETLPYMKEFLDLDKQTETEGQKND